MSIITIPAHGADVYTVQFHNAGMHQFNEQCLSDHYPDVDIISNNPPTQSIPSWISNNSAPTIFTSSMTCPKHVKLIQTDSDDAMNPNASVWSFKPGTKSTNEIKPLPDFETAAHLLVSNHYRIQGQPRHSKLIQHRDTINLSNIVVNRVSADQLTTQQLQQLLRQHILPPKSSSPHISATNLRSLDPPTLS